MKTIQLVIAFVLFFSFDSMAQKDKSPLGKRELTLARGHYQLLQAFSPKPSTANAEIDKLKFEVLQPSRKAERLNLHQI